MFARHGFVETTEKVASTIDVELAFLKVFKKAKLLKVGLMII